YSIKLGSAAFVTTTTTCDMSSAGDAFCDSQIPQSNAFCDAGKCSYQQSIVVGGWSTPLTTGVWHDFVLKVKWSKTATSTYSQAINTSQTGDAMFPFNGGSLELWHGTTTDPSNPGPLQQQVFAAGTGNGCLLNQGQSTFCNIPTL